MNDISSDESTDEEEINKNFETEEYFCTEEYWRVIIILGCSISFESGNENTFFFWWNHFYCSV